MAENKSTTVAPEGATGSGTVNDPFYDIEVQLTGQSNEAFAIMGEVRRALRKHGVPAQEIAVFIDDSMSGDYDHLLQTAMRWVNVL